MSSRPDSALSQTYQSRNSSYAATHPGPLPLPPSKKIAIVTCMDARIDPAKALGIELGDAHIIRNAGGRTQEALRSLIISQQLLGTREIAVIHHTDCGMLTFTNEDLHSKLSSQGAHVPHIDFLPFPHLEQSVKDDVNHIKQSKGLVEAGNVTGWVYEVETGKIREVK